MTNTNSSNPSLVEGKGVPLTEIAARCRGELHGSGDVVIRGVQPLELAEAGDLSFFAPKSARSAKFLRNLLNTSKASAILVTEYLADCPRPQIVVKNPYGTAIVLIGMFYKPLRLSPGIHPTAIVAPSAQLAEDVAIAAYAVIGENVRIGARTVIHPHVVIYDDVTLGTDCQLHAHAVVRERSVLGNDCLIQPGVIIGGDGFGYIPNSQTGHQRIPHSGRTILEDRVDLGSNTTVDRATFGETRIKEGAKIDNLVMVGHNDVIGKNAFICSQVGLSGSVTVGDNVTLAGQVGVADHVSIGDNVRAAARAGITGNVESNLDIGGFPAQPVREWRREIANIRRIPSLFTKQKRSE